MNSSSAARQSAPITRRRPRVAGVAWLLLWGSACAEVTQGEPESALDEAAGSGGNPTGAVGPPGPGRIGATTSGGGSGQSGSPSGGSGTAGSFTGYVPGGTSGSSGSSPFGGGGGALGGSGGGAGQGGTTVPEFPAGMELFREDFEADDVSRWTTAGGVWARSLDAETNSNVFGQSSSSASDVLLAVSGDVSWRDVRVEVDFKVLAFNGSSSSYLAGICVRVADAENFYAIGLRGDSNRHIGIRRFGSSDTNLSQSEFSGSENVWYHLRVDVIGSTLSAYVDGSLVLEQTDSEHAAGGIGLCTTRASAVFDNIVVTAP